MPKMYVKPISTRFSRGRLTPAIRAIAQPCRCLWRGLGQITMTRPCLRMTRHLSHMVLTLALTFTIPFQIQRMERFRRLSPSGHAAAKREAAW